MKQSINRKSFIICGHVFAWIVIIGAPLMFMWQTGNVRTPRLYDYILKNIFYAVVFYINYSFLVERYIYKKKIIKFLLINAVIILTCLLLQHFLKDIFFVKDLSRNFGQDAVPAFRKPPHMPPPYGMRWFLDSMPLLLIVGLSVAFRVTMLWYKLEAERNELQNKQIAAELANLKNQLNPHFLFNTLNNIYSLTSINPDKAQEAIHRLSNLLRYLLYDNNHETVLLNKDIDFTKSFIELMTLRLGKNVELTTNINYGHDDDKIAPLLFISMIENAFKHGINPIEKSFVDIKIECTPRKSVTCVVRNSYFPKNERDQSGSGIGQENTRRRLELLYSNKYICHTEVKNNIYEAILTVEL